MHEYILKNWRIVKVATTKAQRKLFFNLRKSKKRLGWLNAAEVRAVAADLNVPEREVLEMESHLSGRDIGFDAPTSDDDDHAPPSPAAYLRTSDEDPSEAYERMDSEDHQLRLLREGMSRLRSEEHTSELQSLMRISYAVFCLKQKKKSTKHMSQPPRTTDQE